MKKIFELIKTPTLFLILFTLLLGVVYPFFTYFTGTLFFHHKANGSLIYDNKEVLGSALIGQNFINEKYFHNRPTRAIKAYDPLSDSEDYYGPTSKLLYEVIEKEIQTYKLKNNISSNNPLPVDAITASHSGLDPDISIANALLQVPRVAKARNMREEQLIKLIKKLQKKPFLKIIGQKRINVLLLNLAIDSLNKTAISN
jgi:potassium-transporting ATPase KdpC subunit